MSKVAPNWALWKRVRDVSVKEAVELTLNIEPRSAGTARTSEYSDRLFLIERELGSSIRMTLTELANWSQSVAWNIPVELGALAPAPSTTTTYQLAPADIVTAAITKIVAPGERESELLDALISEGWRFVTLDHGYAIHISDGTVHGSMVPLDQLYQIVSSLCCTTTNNRIAHLVRASRASGGGALTPSYYSGGTPEKPAPLIFGYPGTKREQLIALADEVANEVRGNRPKVGVTEICRKLTSDTYRKKHSKLLSTQKDWASKTWLLDNGLKGWVDPLERNKKTDH